MGQINRFVNTTALPGEGGRTEKIRSTAFALPREVDPTPPERNIDVKGVQTVVYLMNQRKKVSAALYDTAVMLMDLCAVCSQAHDQTKASSSGCRWPRKVHWPYGNAHILCRVHITLMVRSTLLLWSGPHDSYGQVHITLMVRSTLLL